MTSNGKSKWCWCVTDKLCHLCSTPIDAIDPLEWYAAMRFGSYPKIHHNLCGNCLDNGPKGR